MSSLLLAREAPAVLVPFQGVSIAATNWKPFQFGDEY